MRDLRSRERESVRESARDSVRKSVSESVSVESVRERVRESVGESESDEQRGVMPRHCREVLRRHPQHLRARERERWENVERRMSRWVSAGRECGR